MDYKVFADEIRKTGFVLENSIAQTLKKAGWTVISNKYYVDDFEESVREIDLVAYRVSKTKGFDVYTTLIISCKKSEHNIWSLLARDINLKDPNSNWWPLHTWSNDKALEYQLQLGGTARRFHNEIEALGVNEVLAIPEVEVFAFQEMDKKTGKPQNDKPIFSAITSLMKAQAYELSALPLRKKSPAVYQFNLISVVDAEIVRLMFKDEDIVGTPLQTEQYLASYIVKKRETFSRIRFIKASFFSKALKNYDQLHQANTKWFGSECDKFYELAVKDWDRSKVFISDFNKDVAWLISHRLQVKFGRNIVPSEFIFEWNEESKILEIGVDYEQDKISYLNEDVLVQKRVSSALKNIYRYEGEFRFELDIPF